MMQSRNGIDRLAIVRLLFEMTNNTAYFMKQINAIHIKFVNEKISNYALEQSYDIHKYQSYEQQSRLNKWTCTCI